MIRYMLKKLKYRCFNALFTFTTAIINDQDSLASEDDLLCDPVAIVEEAVVGQGVLEHVDLSRPLERP